MVNYQNSIIYGIRTPTGLYVGSTTNYTRRKCGHRVNIYNQNVRGYNYNLYVNIRENDCKWEMYPIKKFPCNDKLELRIEEENMRKKLNANLNMRSAILDKEKEKRTAKLYYENNKDSLAIKTHNYWEKNKKKIKERKDALNKGVTIKCECGSEVRRDVMCRHKKSNKHINWLKKKEDENINK